jgi:hypothetical protein
MKAKVDVDIYDGEERKDLIGTVSGVVSNLVQNCSLKGRVIPPHRRRVISLRVKPQFWIYEELQPHTVVQYKTNHIIRSCSCEEKLS